MSITRVQAPTSTGTSTTPTGTFSAATAGNLLIAIFQWNENGEAGDLWSGPNPTGWSRDTSATELHANGANGNTGTVIFHKLAAAGGETSVSITLTASHKWSVTVLEYSNAQGRTWSKDQTAGRGGIEIRNDVGSSTTPISTANGSNSTAPEMVSVIVLTARGNATNSAVPSITTANSYTAITQTNSGTGTGNLVSGVYERIYSSLVSYPGITLSITGAPWIVIELAFYPSFVTSDKLATGIAPGSAGAIKAGTSSKIATGVTPGAGNIPRVATYNKTSTGVEVGSGNIPRVGIRSKVTTAIQVASGNVGKNIALSKRTTGISVGFGGMVATKSHKLDPGIYNLTIHFAYASYTINAAGVEYHHIPTETRERISIQSLGDIYRGSELTGRVDTVNISDDLVIMPDEIVPITIT